MKQYHSTLAEVMEDHLFVRSLNQFGYGLYADLKNEFKFPNSMGLRNLVFLDLKETY